MTEHPRLSMLHVGVARHDRPRMAFRLAHHRALEPQQALHRVQHAAAFVVTSNGGALIDAAAARVHSSRSVLADALRQESLDLQQEGSLDGVNLKILRRHGANFQQCLQNGGPVVAGEDALLHQHYGVCEVHRHVVLELPLLAGKARHMVMPQELLGRGARKPRLGQ